MLFMQQRLENKTLREKLALTINENKALHAQIQTLLTTKEKVADLERRHAEMLSEVYSDLPVSSGHPQPAQHSSAPSQPIPNGTAGSSQTLGVGSQSIQSVANEQAIAWRDIVLHHVHNFEERPDVERLLSSKVAQFAATHAIKREQPPLYSKIKSNVTAIPHSLIPQFIKHLGLPPLPTKQQSAQTVAPSTAIPVKPVAQQKSVLPQSTTQSNERIMRMEPIAKLSDGSKNLDRCYAWTDILAVVRPSYPAFDTTPSNLQARLNNFRKRTGLQNTRIQSQIQPGQVVVGIPERFIPDFIEEMTRPSRAGENTFPQVGSSESVAAAENAVQEAVAAAMVGTAGSITAPVTQEVLERSVKRQRMDDDSGSGRPFPSVSVPIGSKERGANTSSESLFSINSEAIAAEMDFKEASKMNVDERPSAVETTSERPMAVMRDTPVLAEQNPELSATVPVTIPTVPKIAISLTKVVTPKNPNSTPPTILPGHTASSRPSPIPISAATAVTADPSNTASPFSAAPTVALGSSVSTPSLQKGQSPSNSNPSISLASNSSALSTTLSKVAQRSDTPIAPSPITAPIASTPIVASQPVSLQVATSNSSNPTISLKPKPATTPSGTASASFALPTSTSKLGFPSVLQASAPASNPPLVDQPKAKQPAGSDSDSLTKGALDGRGNLKDRSISAAKPGKPVERLVNQTDTGTLQTTGMNEDRNIALTSLFDDDDIVLTHAAAMKARGKEQGTRDSFGSSLKRDRDSIDSPASATVSETSMMEARMNGDGKQDILEPRRNSNGSPPSIADDLGDIALNQPVELYQQNDGVLYNVLLRKMMDFDQIATELRHAVKMAVKDFLSEAMPEMGSTLKACEVYLGPGIPGKEDQVTYLIPTTYVPEFCEWIYEELLRVFPERCIQKIPEMADYT
ncbi:hypothetical protein HDU81_010528 [Chytriomyces hyalinus]|nr:hypothetical protein HDU81_010528 [Chytriomyces hyalinus]